MDQATTNGLNIILNVHHYSEIDAQPAKHLPRLMAIWKQIATRYKDKPANVYFELLNEPNDKLSEATWNAAIPVLLAAVRNTNPARPVIVGPAYWNGISALDKLKLPPDKNLILTVHFYDPLKFTHQAAPWMENSGEWKGTQWSGTEEEQAAVRVSLNKVVGVGEEAAEACIFGGVRRLQEADMDSRVRWTRFVAREAEKRDFSWAYWEFCSGFGAYDPQTDHWQPALKGALLGTGYRRPDLSNKRQ